MLRCCTAASAHNAGPCLQNQSGLRSKFFRCHTINSLTVNHFRHAVIWLGYNRNIGVCLHLTDKFRHLFRTGWTIDAHRISPQRLQNYHGCTSVCSKKCSSVFIKRKRHTHRQVCHFANGNQRRTALIQTHHCLNNKKINSRIHQITGLFFVNINQSFKSHITHRCQLTTGHSHIPGHQTSVPGCRLWNGYKLMIHLFNLIYQPVLIQFDSVGCKSRSQHDITACLKISFLQLHHCIRMFQNPCLRTHTRRHACLLQIRSGGTIQKNDSFSAQSLKFFSCHLS